MKESNKPVVSGCPFEHDPKFGNTQEIIYREIKNKHGKKLYFMQCGCCGSCGPVATTVKKAARRWNMRLVKVYPRDEFDRLKNEANKGQKDGSDS